MAPRVNLLSGLTRNGAGWTGKSRQRFYLAILVLSGIVGAGAVAELLAGLNVEHPE
jgi:hypothetical protein